MFTICSTLTHLKPSFLSEFEATDIFIFFFISPNLFLLSLTNSLQHIQSTTWVKKESEIEAAKDRKKGEHYCAYKIDLNFITIDNFLPYPFFNFLYIFYILSLFYTYILLVFCNSCKCKLLLLSDV